MAPVIKYVFFINKLDPNLVTDGLILQYDFSNHNSYPGSGDTVYDMVGGRHGTIYNDPTYSTDKGGYLELWLYFI